MKKTIEEICKGCPIYEDKNMSELMCSNCDNWVDVEERINRPLTNAEKEFLKCVLTDKNGNIVRP